MRRTFQFVGGDTGIMREETTTLPLRPFIHFEDGNLLPVMRAASDHTEAGAIAAQLRRDGLKCFDRSTQSFSHKPLTAGDRIEFYRVARG